MFTLKLYKRLGPGPGVDVISHVMAVDHVQTRKCGDHALQIWAFHAPAPSHYDTFYVGDFGPESDAVDDININGNHYGWGLLENWEGNTSEHYRPASYG